MGPTCPLSVVMIDWGNLRGQIFSRTAGFAPSDVLALRGRPNINVSEIFPARRVWDRVSSKIKIEPQKG